MISAGQNARRDPVLAFSADVASRLMMDSSPLPPAKRMAWLRRELNKTSLGLGDKFEDRLKEFERRSGSRKGQPLFDALRLELANFFAANIDRRMSKQGTAGLGALGINTSRLADGLCAAGAVGAGAAGIVLGAQGRAQTSQSVMNASTQALQLAGCGRKDAEIQARAAEARAREAEANAAAAAAAAAAQANQGKKTMVYVAIGGGVLVVGVLGVMLLRK